MRYLSNKMLFEASKMRKKIISIAILLSVLVVSVFVFLLYTIQTDSPCGAYYASNLLANTCDVKSVMRIMDNNAFLVWSYVNHPYEEGHIYLYRGVWEFNSTNNTLSLTFIDDLKADNPPFVAKGKCYYGGLYLFDMPSNVAINGSCFLHRTFISPAKQSAIYDAFFD